MLTKQSKYARTSSFFTDFPIYCTAFIVAWTVGRVENASFFIKFRISQTFGEILLIHRKKRILPKFEGQWTFFRQGTPRLKIKKNNENHQILVLFDIFLDSYETWNKKTNTNYLCKHLWADTRKFCNQCQTGCNSVWVCVKEA